MNNLQSLIILLEQVSDVLLKVEQSDNVKNLQTEIWETVRWAIELRGEDNGS